MIRGLYTSATGLDAGMRRMDIVSNNLANVSTTGYKREQAHFQSLLDREIYRFSHDTPPFYLGQLGSGVNFRFGSVDWGTGPIIATDDPLHIALVDPPGARTFLAVEDPQNQRAYTKSGQLTVDGAGYLRSLGGSYVLGLNSMGMPERLQIPNPQELLIAQDGSLTGADGRPLGRLYLVNAGPDANFTRRGDSLFTIDGALETATEAVVRQGHLEQANVQAIREMVDLIAAMRNYETNTKLIQIQDETLGKAVNEVGRL